MASNTALTQGATSILAADDGFEQVTTTVNNLAGKIQIVGGSLIVLMLVVVCIVMIVSSAKGGEGGGLRKTLGKGMGVVIGGIGLGAVGVVAPMLINIGGSIN